MAKTEEFFHPDAPPHRNATIVRKKTDKPTMTQTVAPNATVRLNGFHLARNTTRDVGHVLPGVVRVRPRPCSYRLVAAAHVLAGAQRRQNKAIVWAAASSGDDPLSSVNAKSELADKLQGVEVLSADSGRSHRDSFSNALLWLRVYLQLLWVHSVTGHRDRSNTSVNET